MIYTINGKEYTEFDINKRCAELIGSREVNFCRSAHYTWPIIEKVFDFLESRSAEPLQSEWQHLIEKHNCTKLVAACICLIEMEGYANE